MAPILYRNFPHRNCKMEWSNLADDRTVSVPLAWSLRLLRIFPDDRAHHRFPGQAQGIHWPDLDEDISVENKVTGRMSGEGSRSFQRWLQARSHRRSKKRTSLNTKTGPLFRQF